jgi:hypothetical protein
MDWIINWIIGALFGTVPLVFGLRNQTYTPAIMSAFCLCWSAGPLVASSVA